MKNLVYGLTVLFLLIMLYRAECGRPVVVPSVDKVVIEGKKYDLIKKVVDTQYVKYTEKGKSDTVVHDTTIYVKIPILDSVQLDSLIKLYYAKNVFSDTFKLKYGNVYVQDSVQQNRIIGRNWGADLLIPTEKTTITVKEPARNQVYFGPKIDYSTSVIPGVGLMLKTKRDRLYGVSVSVGKTPVYGGSLYIKLF
jgi:hypothetical protein